MKSHNRTLWRTVLILDYFTTK